MFMNYRRKQVIDACISSKVLPLVFDTSFAIEENSLATNCREDKKCWCIKLFICRQEQEQKKKKGLWKLKLVCVLVHTCNQNVVYIGKHFKMAL